MNAEQRNAYVAAKAKERGEIQAKIQKLNDQRNQFLAEERKNGSQQGNTLGSAVKQAVREQAAKKNYTFKPVEATPSAGEKTPEQK